LHKVLIQPIEILFWIYLFLVFYTYIGYGVLFSVWANIYGVVINRKE